MGVAGRFDRRASKMDSTPENKSEKPEKSYLSTAVDSISPWGGSRSSTPKPKPKLLKGNEENAKPPGVPKKFVTFSLHDSRSIESAYQKLADEYDDPNRDVRQKGEDDTSGSQSPSSSGKQPNTSIDEAGQDTHAGGKVKVPIQEDFLFDVDIEQRELSPVYWL